MTSTLGPFLKSVRKKAGLSQAELARMAGIGKTAVFDLEHAKATVRLDTLLKVLRVLNIKAWLAGPLGERIVLEGEEP